MSGYNQTQTRVGLPGALEIILTGRQRLEDDPYRTFTPTATTVELLVSKGIGGVTVFADGENLTNVRQTGWDPLLRKVPGRGGRWTTEEWAPLEGRVLEAASLGPRSDPGNVQRTPAHRRSIPQPRRTRQDQGNGSPRVPPRTA